MYKNFTKPNQLYKPSPKCRLSSGTCVICKACMWSTQQRDNSPIFMPGGRVSSSMDAPSANSVRSTSDGRWSQGIYVTPLSTSQKSENCLYSFTPLPGAHAICKSKGQLFSIIFQYGEHQFSDAPKHTFSCGWREKNASALLKRCMIREMCKMCRIYFHIVPHAKLCKCVWMIHSDQHLRVDTACCQFVSRLCLGNLRNSVCKVAAQYKPKTLGTDWQNVCGTSISSKSS